MNRLKIEILDYDKFIKANNCKEITNPILFQNGNRPTEDGLLSEEIFGITQTERAGIFGYIDLHQPFLHPYFYKIWLKLDKNLRGCIYETGKYRLDENGYLVEDPNGNSGIIWLYNNQNKLGFKNTKRSELLNALLKGKKDKSLFITKFLVIPPYFRDVDTKTNGRVGVGEINKLYVQIINSTKALQDMVEYGFDVAGPTRGRIQDLLMEVFNWFTVGESIIGGEHTGSGIFKKFGVFRRAVMSKTTDNSARLVLSAPMINVERREELMVDTDHCAVPLSAACTIAYPFMINYLHNRFFNKFSGRTKFPIKDKKTGTIEYVELENSEIEFSDDRFDEEMNEFIHGYSNRLKPVEVTLKNGEKYPLYFKGYYISEEEYARGVRENGNIIERKLTWLDILYQAAVIVTESKHVLVARYPIDSYFNQVYLKMNVTSYKKTKPTVIDGKLYKWYPDFTDQDIGSETSSDFIDTLSVSNLMLALMGADYDGDMVTVKLCYLDESNAELEKYMNSKAQFIDFTGKNGRNPDKEAVQAIYNLTLVLNDDKNKITPSEQIQFG